MGTGKLLNSKMLTDPIGHTMRSVSMIAHKPLDGLAYAGGLGAALMPTRINREVTDKYQTKDRDTNRYVGNRSYWS